MSAVVTPPDLHALAAEVKRHALQLGFNVVGIAPAGPSAYRAYFRQWLDDGKAGEMHYLHRRFDERTDPGTFLPGAKSVVCVAMNYHVPLEPMGDADRADVDFADVGRADVGRANASEAADVGRADVRRADIGRVARYALGDDYHEIIKQRLYDLADHIRDAAPGTRTKCGVDTAGVMEKELAARAGVGWIGKNTLVINPQIGSWLFLGEVITTLDLPTDEPAVDRCGTCTRCIDACPTGAITAPYEIDARRCISYLTIEHRGDVATDLAAMSGDWVYGCDVCQDVCPWNSRAITSLEPSLQPRLPTGTLNLSAVAAWDEAAYHAATRRSTLRRVKLPIFQRNARNAAQNYGGTTEPRP